MRAKEIRSKLARYYHQPSDTILLEVISGKPRSREGGVWTEVTVDDMERLTEDPNFDRESSGWGKYFDKWETEGLLIANGILTR